MYNEFINKEQTGRPVNKEEKGELFMKLRKRIISTLLSVCMLLTAAPLTTQAATAQSIPKTAVQYQGSYYQVYSGKYTWAKAKKFCKSKGGQLAVINSAKENAFLYNYIRSKGYTSAYFGATDSFCEGKWRDVNGKKLEYTNWAPGEPNGENKKEDYAMFYYKYPSGKWNDGDFSGNVTFICEWTKKPASTPKVTSINVRTGVIKGRADKNTTVYLSIDGYKYSGKVNKSGVFQIKIDYKKFRGFKTLKLYSIGAYTSQSKVKSVKACFLNYTSKK